MLLIEETKYLTGANAHAPTSAFWVRGAISGTANTGEMESRFLQRLDSAGISAHSVSARAAKAAPKPANPLAHLAAALVEVLEHGVIKGSRRLPEVFTCQGDGNAFAITSADEEEAREALELVLDLFNGDSESSVEALRSFVSGLTENAYQPSLGVILKAAENMGIPWSWNEGIGYHQLGHGCHRTRIEATITGKLPAVGVHIARRKSVTNALLRSFALPAPLSIPTNDVDEAVAAALKIRYPLVVKPMIGHKGVGITVGVSSAGELLTAFKKARKISGSVIVEQFIPGGDVRLLVVGRKLVAAASRIPPQVTGDGERTVSQLIDIENSRRQRNPGVALPIEIDSDLIHTLEGQGLSLNSMLPANAVARLRTVANWSQGGTAADLTDLVHPDNADMAVRAALAVGIDVAGVDFITPDISRPYYEVGGAICEINYRPGLRVHMAADPDCKRDLGSPIIDSLFAGDGRIDVVYAVDAGSSAFANALAARFADAGKLARVACAYEAPEQWLKNIELSLDDPECDALIVNAPASAIVNLGAGIDNCRLVVRFGNDDAVTAGAIHVLDKICRPENMLVAVADENVNVAAARIAGVLGLITKPRERTPPPAEITASRDLLEIARSRGLAAKELAYWNSRPLLQIGYGASQSIYRGRRTGATSHIATRIADDKRRTNALLKAHGLPHATQAVVESIPAAVRAAGKFGYPVIVKPTGSSESRGVTGNILNDEELAAAVRHALLHSRKVIVEPFLKGTDHRFLIIGGKMAHVTRHETAHVTGDGKSTVEELVAKANENPIRGPEVHQPYTWLDLGDDAQRMLVRQGLTAKSMPASGQPVILSSICHLSTGATAVDVTALAHRDNIAAAERIARLIGLDICGVDFLLPDVTRSYREAGGVIVEVNQGPSLDMHDASTNSTNRVRSLVLGELTKGWDGRQIPLVNCILSVGFPTEAVARSVLLRMRSDFSVTAGAALPALGLALIGSATVKSPTGDAASICSSILGDARVEAALLLTVGKQILEIPESAKTLDFCSPMQNRTVEEVAEAIVKEFAEALRGSPRPHEFHFEVAEPAKSQALHV